MRTAVGLLLVAGGAGPRADWPRRPRRRAPSRRRRPRRRRAADARRRPTPSRCRITRRSPPRATRRRPSTEVYLQARSGLLPQVNAYGDAVHADSDNTRLMAGGINNPSVFSRTAIGASLTQLITDFGHTTNLAASARLQASAAEQSSLATREQVLLQVDQAYFGALQAHGVESVARQTLDTRQLLLDRVSVLAENKLKSDLDVSFARVALEQARLLLQRAQNDVDSSLAALSTVLGYREQRIFSLADETSVPVPASADVQPLIDQALHDRPELAGPARPARRRAAPGAVVPRCAPADGVGTGGGRQFALPRCAPAGQLQRRRHPGERAGVCRRAVRGTPARGRAAGPGRGRVAAHGGGRHQPRRARRLAQPQQCAPAAAHQSAAGALRGRCLPAGRCTLPGRQQLDRGAQPGAARAHDRADRRDHGALRSAAARIRPQLSDRRRGGGQTLAPAEPRADPNALPEPQRAATRRAAAR